LLCVPNYQTSTSILEALLPNNAIMTQCLLNSRTWKKCKFPRKLIKISCGTQVEDNHPFMMSQKELVFLKTLHSRVCHCIHIDQLGLIQPTSISSHWTCKQLHRYSVPCYRSVRKKTRYRRSANRPVISLGHLGQAQNF